MQIYMNKAFSRFAKSAGIASQALCDAVVRAEKGLIDADLGGGVIKQRIARPGKGRSGGFGTLIVVKSRVRAVYIYGFAKNAVDNVGSRELMALKKLAAELLSFENKMVEKAVRAGVLTEVNCEKTIS